MERNLRRDQRRIDRDVCHHVRGFDFVFPLRWPPPSVDFTIHRMVRRSTAGGTWCGLPIRLSFPRAVRRGRNLMRVVSFLHHAVPPSLHTQVVALWDQAWPRDGGGERPAEHASACR